MKSVHLPMTIEEFHRLPHRLGWKHEYYGGKAHITPAHTAVSTASLPVTRRKVAPPCPLRQPTPDDLDGLVPAFYAAFADTTDYCDMEMQAIVKSGQRVLEGFFDGERGRPLPASRLALESAVDDGDKIVGAALLVEKSNGSAFLDLLFVIPEWRRRGVATALLGDALNALHDEGYPELSSRFLLGNETSRVWHHHFGFVDQPDHFSARHYHRHYQQEWERLHSLGGVDETELAALAAQRDHWWAVVEELDERERREGRMIISILD